MYPERVGKRVVSEGVGPHGIFDSHGVKLDARDMLSQELSGTYSLCPKRGTESESSAQRAAGCGSEMWK